MINSYAMRNTTSINLNIFEEKIKFISKRKAKTKKH
jgi:hypothetical protein